MTGGPHAGITVVELGEGVAVAYAGMLLADRGAQVIRIEDARTEDLGSEHVAHDAAEHAAAMKRAQWLGRGKRSLLLALDSARHDAATVERALSVLHGLLARADVLLTDLPQARLRSLGLDADALCTRHPQLQLVRDSGFGDAGPLAGMPVTDLVMQARSGLLAGEGKSRADGVTPERLHSTDMAGHATGMLLSLATAAALLQRELRRDGIAFEEVVVPQFGVALALQAARTADNPAADRLRLLAQSRLAAARAAGAGFAELRASRADAALPPGNIFYRPFRTRDGAVFLGALSRPLRDKVRRVLGTGYLYRDDPRFDPADAAFMAECVEQERRTEAQFRTRTSAEWVAAFDAAGVPCGEVVFPEDLPASAQVRENDYMVPVLHPRDGLQWQVATPARFSRWPVFQPAAAPLPGHGADALPVLEAPTPRA